MRGYGIVVLQDSIHGVTPCRKGVQRERLAHRLRSRCSVLHCYTADSENVGSRCLLAVDCETAVEQFTASTLRCCGVPFFRLRTTLKEMMKMPYAILRFAKRKTGGVTANYVHNERKKTVYKSNPDINTDRSKDNYHFVEPRQTYCKEVNRIIAEAGCKTRSNSTVMVETLITASPEFMNILPPEEQREYFSRAFEFMAEKIGKDNIISAVVHMDEKTPHMHLSFCPITEDKRLSAKSILGNQAQLSKWQTWFHECMSSRWNVLERGLSSMETKRKHIPVWLFKTAERLDKQFDGITAALTNINALNAGKKRDKALSLLAEWLPEAEKFTAQIKTVDEYIKRLKQDVEIKEKNTQYWKCEANENKEKLIDRTLEIRRLQTQLEKQKRLLDRISPEVLEQLKIKKERGSDR